MGLATTARSEDRTGVLGTPDQLGAKEPYHARDTFDEVARPTFS